MKTKWSCGEAIGVLLVLGILFLVGWSLLSTGLAKNESIKPIIGIALISIPFLSIAGFILSKLGNRFGWSGRGVALSTIVISIFAVTTFTLYTRAQICRPPDPMLTSLAGVCEGGAVAEARGFDPAKLGTYHVVILDSSGQLHEWDKSADPEWKSASIQDVELVLCIGGSRWLDDPSCWYKISAEELDVWLVNAKTGETIAETTFTTPFPICQQVKTAVTNTRNNVTFGEVKNWLQGILSDITPSP